MGQVFRAAGRAGHVFCSRLFLIQVFEPCFVTFLLRLPGAAQGFWLCSELLRRGGHFTRRRGRSPSAEPLVGQCDHARVGIAAFGQSAGRPRARRAGRLPPAPALAVRRPQGQAAAPRRERALALGPWRRARRRTQSFAAGERWVAGFGSICSVGLDLGFPPPSNSPPPEAFIGSPHSMIVEQQFRNRSKSDLFLRPRTMSNASKQQDDETSFHDQLLSDNDSVEEQEEDENEAPYKVGGRFQSCRLGFSARIPRAELASLFGHQRAGPTAVPAQLREPGRVRGAGQPLLHSLPRRDGLLLQESARLGRRSPAKAFHRRYRREQ